MNHNTSNDTGYIVGSVLTTYASTYSELKERKEELSDIKSELNILDKKMALVQQNTQVLSNEFPKLNNQLRAIEQTLTEMNSKLEQVVSERKWYKTAAGFTIAASISIISFIVFLISYSDEVAAIKNLLNQLIEMNK
ncbi:hypothetical protein [Mannheimia indoligenes]|uniref:hypothetical protein n=1 Tax=Mannheimia indoligenes TaxID=3103145 RepID=UPI002FE6A9BA